MICGVPRTGLCDLSADPKDYAVTPWPQRLEPDSLAALRPQRYFRLGPGWLKIGLAVFGLAAGLWWRRYRAWTAFCLTMLVAAFLLSLGPRLSVGGWSPYVLLMDWYPGMAQARNVYRFAVFVQLAVVLLAALGLQAVLTRFPTAKSGTDWQSVLQQGGAGRLDASPMEQRIRPPLDGHRGPRTAGDGGSASRRPTTVSCATCETQRRGSTGCNPRRRPTA